MSSGMCQVMVNFGKLRLMFGICGHPDFTGRVRAGTLCRQLKDATHGVAAVGALLLLLGFKVTLGPVRGKCLPAGLHAAEASYVSASSLSAFRC